MQVSELKKKKKREKPWPPWTCIYSDNRSSGLTCADPSGWLHGPFAAVSTLLYSLLVTIACCCLHCTFMPDLLCFEHVACFPRVCDLPCPVVRHLVFWP